MISIHALREERDQKHFKFLFCGFIISIHALREERDLAIFFALSIDTISIHALREERDPRTIRRGRRTR